VAANTPALDKVTFTSFALSSADLLPLFTALPFNTHLRLLFIISDKLSVEFMRDVVLSAVRANTSLRQGSGVFGLFSLSSYTAADDTEAAEVAALRDIQAQIKVMLSGRD
jgi:hypothetical protein